MIKCNRCNLQYISENQKTFGIQSTVELLTLTIHLGLLHAVSEHFLSNPYHTATDMQLIPIENIFSSQDSICKAREATLVIKAKTIEPCGLNARDERHLSLSFINHLVLQKLHVTIRIHLHTWRRLVWPTEILCI